MSSSTGSLAQKVWDATRIPPKVNKKDLRIRLAEYINKKVAAGEWVWLNQTEIAEKLKTSQPEISRALRNLVQIKFLSARSVGKSKMHKINTQF